MSDPYESDRDMCDRYEERINELVAERDEWKASYQTAHQTSQQLAEELTKQDAERDALKARLAEARWIIDQSVQEYVLIPEYQQRRDAWLKEVTGEPT